MKQIHLKKGAGVMLVGVVTMFLALSLMILVMEYGNINYCKIVSQTRSDIIADSTAVYAQSFDYNYNQGQAEKMAELLTTYNNDVSNGFELTSEISFPQDNDLSVVCTCQTNTFYPNLIGRDKIITQAQSDVTSVNIYENVVYIPDLK